MSSLLPGTCWPSAIWCGLPAGMPGLWSLAASVVIVAEVLTAVEAELARLRAENARLLRLLKMTPEQAAPPGPGQAGFFEAPPGLVDDGSPPEVKVAFLVRCSLPAPTRTPSGMTIRVPVGAAGACGPWRLAQGHEA